MLQRDDICYMGNNDIYSNDKPNAQHCGKATICVHLFSTIYHYNAIYHYIHMNHIVCPWYLYMLQCISIYDMKVLKSLHDYCMLIVCITAELPELMDGHTLSYTAISICSIYVLYNTATTNDHNRIDRCAAAACCQLLIQHHYVLTSMRYIAAFCCCYCYAIDAHYHYHLVMLMIWYVSCASL